MYCNVTLEIFSYIFATEIIFQFVLVVELFSDGIERPYSFRLAIPISLYVLATRIELSRLNTRRRVHSRVNYNVQSLFILKIYIFPAQRYNTICRASHGTGAGQVFE